MLLRYTINGLFARWRSLLSTFLAIAVTVGAVVVILGVLEGLFGTILESGNPRNALVLSQGSPSEEMSTLSNEQLNAVKVLPGVTHLSPEYITTIRFPLPTRGDQMISVRGVDREALEAHGGSLLRGRWPERGAHEVVVGAKRLERFGDVGQTVRINREQWPVVGVLQAPGRFESELWCDRAALMSLTRSPVLSSVVVTLDSPEGFARFAEQVAKIQPNPLEVVSEKAYYRRSTEKLAVYLQAVVVVIIVLVLGAIFACINLLYASFLDRIRELGTLMAIGYKRSSIAWLVVQEGLLLALAGGALGVGVGYAANGHTMRMNDGQLTYQIHVTLRVLGAGAAVSALIGLLGSFIAAMQALRIDVLRAIRG